ncbi:MAG: hypothetical protein ABI743_06920 [bacterium]
MGAVIGQVTGPGEVGVFGESALFEGVRGVSHSSGHGGVVGINDNPSHDGGQGVFGESENGEGVRGISHSPDHGGVVGTNDKGEGVRGISHSPGHGGVVGSNDSSGAGVHGESTGGEGVRGISHSPDHGGVVGTNDDGEGVHGESRSSAGVSGVSHGQVAAVTGTNDNGAGVGVFGKAPRLAGWFEGNVLITGKLDLQGSDVGGLVQALVKQVNDLQRQVADLRQGTGNSGGSDNHGGSDLIDMIPGIVEGIVVKLLPTLL